jgi:dephospho-CoA kinase
MICHAELIKNFQLLKTDHRLHKIPTPIVAITGGIASGKSTVVQYLKQKGLGVLSADVLIKEIYQLDTTKVFLQQLVPQVLSHDGQVDFKTLRTLTFTNEVLKGQLENYLYSKLPETFWKFYKSLPAHHYFFYEVPLLFEKKLNPLVDLIVLIYADKNIQLTRLKARDASSDETNLKILQAQMSFEEKKDHAHFILENNSDEKNLNLQIDELLKTINLLIKP